MADEIEDTPGSGATKPDSEEQASRLTTLSAAEVGGADGKAGSAMTGGEKASVEGAAHVAAEVILQPGQGTPSDKEAVDYVDSEDETVIPTHEVAGAENLKAEERHGDLKAASSSPSDPYQPTYGARPASAATAFRDTQTGSSSDKSAKSGPRVTQADASYGHDGDLRKPGLGLLYDVELDATLQFGSKEMLLRDVLELGPGDVVELDRHIAEPVDLVVGDRIVARGEVVVASGNFALRVTEVATPQMRLESIRCLF